MLLSLAENYQLHYKIIPGNLSKPYLVFLHEGLGCIDMWGEFPQKICQLTGCPGLVYDRLGYGRSSAELKTRSIHYLHQSALWELPRVLQGLIAHRQYFLIGHSDGGSISLISAAEQNPLLQGVVTAAAHVFVEPETLLGIEQAQHAWRAGKLQSLIKYHGDKTPQIFSAWANTWRQPWFKHWNIEYLLPSVRVPMLVIQGANDQYASEEQVLSIVEKTAGKSLAKIIENCAHSPHAQAQSKVLEAMQGFINAIIYSQNRITS